MPSHTEQQLHEHQEGGHRAVRGAHQAGQDPGEARQRLQAEGQPRRQPAVREAEEGRGQEAEGRQGQGVGDAVLAL